MASTEREKILIIRYLQSLKRRIVERILRHSFFVRPVSIFCDPSETFRDQTNTFGNTSHAKRERERENERINYRYTFH